MKKIYVSPSVKVVAISQVNMIAVSLGNGTTSFDGIELGGDGEFADVKSDRGWDIWGSGDADFEEE